MMARPKAWVVKAAATLKSPKTELMNQPRSCGVLIVRGRPVREVLLMCHADRYDLPKGHVDSGETDLQCALRELEEETGIAAADVEIDPEFRFTTQYMVCNERTNHQEVEKTLVMFLGYLQRDEVSIVLTEHKGFEWIRWNPPHQNQQNTIDPLLQHLAEHLTKTDGDN